MIVAFLAATVLFVKSLDKKEQRITSFCVETTVNSNTYAVATLFAHLLSSNQNKDRNQNGHNL